MRTETQRLVNGASFGQVAERDRPLMPRGLSSYTLPSHDDASHGARAERLLRVTTALSMAMTVEDVTTAALGPGLDVFGADRGCFARYDGGELNVIHAADYDDALRQRVKEVNLDDETPLTGCIRTGQSVFLTSVDQCRTTYPQWFENVGPAVASQAHVALPLLRGHTVIGALAMSFAKANAFGTADRVFTQLLAHATAAALARAIDVATEQASRREAELLARGQQEVLAVVAHDLRNPLNLITNAAELLAESDLPMDRRQQLLAVSVRAANQMDQMIGDLLDASRIRAGILSVDIMECDAAQILDQVAETMRPAAQQCGIELRILRPTSGSRLEADPCRLAQALGNLVANALKFTAKSGSVSLRVRAGRKIILIEVSDTGAGISASDRAHLFDKFWQARRDSRGLGLGLAIVKGIVDAHGGRIFVRSEPGVGSVFALALPIRHASASLSSTS
jgi:signal transduction histidine kinase